MSFPLFEEFSKSHTVKDLIIERNDNTVVDGDENLSIQEVYNIFLENNLRCLPIYRSENGEKKYIGYITLFDLIPGDILKMLKEKMEDSNCDINEIIDNLDYFKQPVKNFLKEINLELKIITQDVTIRELINILCKYNHHCLVKNDNNEYEIITQVDLVNYLFNHIEKIDEELLDQQAKDCAGLVLKKAICNVEGRVSQEFFHDIKLLDFITISYKESALEGFLLMLEKKVECVGIIDKNDSIISVLTSGNVRGLNPDALKQFVKPVLPFLKNALDDIPEPYTCTENYTIIQLIKKLTYYQTRRLIVINKEDEPIGIVSMSDIVSSFNIEEFKKLD